MRIDSGYAYLDSGVLELEHGSPSGFSQGVWDVDSKISSDQSEK